MQLDNDLSIPPFVPITEADEWALAEQLAAKELPGLPYEHRVWIAYYATTNPGWDIMQIHSTLVIEHDVTVPLYLIDAFLTFTH